MSFADNFNKLMAEDLLVEMSNVRGKEVKNPHKLPFSFYFSSGVGLQHGIRVKPAFDPEKLKGSLTGVLKLCDDWAFIPGINDKNVSQAEIDEMKQFFKDNIVLFVLVWDEFLQDGIVADYLQGRVPFESVIHDIDFYDDFHNILDNCKTVKDLELTIRKNINAITRAGYNVNFYGN